MRPPTLFFMVLPVSVSVPGSIIYLYRLYFVPLLVLSVHGHELEDHEVQDGCDDGQPEHDEEQGKGHIL